MDSLIVRSFLGPLHIFALLYSDRMTDDSLEGRFQALTPTILPAWALRSVGGSGSSQHRLVRSLRPRRSCLRPWAVANWDTVVLTPQRKGVTALPLDV